MFEAVGARVRLHALDLDSGREIAVGADEPVVLASVFKVLLVLEFARQADAGQLDPRHRVTVGRADRLGGWGTAGCLDDVEMSLRDLAFFTMSVSDNSAADALLRHVGLDTVRMLAAELGLDRTRVVGGPRELLASMLQDVGARDEAEFARLYPTLGPEKLRTLRVLDADRTTRGTARDMTRLLRLIWQDRAGSPAACAWVRELMERQVFRHRIVSGFPDGVRIAAKTGTLPGLHMEVGVVTHPDGGRYALAVFAATDAAATDSAARDTAAMDRAATASAASARADRPAVDATIGRAARAAVDALRGAR
ncbi:serine hydrolase [Streptomyces sp. NPDC050504]|uniref:serine hydrolase n=1 Tax=Streptomyces sp. NPDC050504 TaxID=3365618 RepID=UPI0037A12763